MTTTECVAHLPSVEEVPDPRPVTSPTDEMLHRLDNIERKLDLLISLLEHAATAFRPLRKVLDTFRP